MGNCSPNILIAMADQLSPQFTSAYGHPLVKTPNLEVLANRGTRFDSAYCNSPLCAPARFCFMLGQLVTAIYEAGICGTCLTDVFEGEIDHRDQILTDAEKQAQDVIAICCSQARSATIVLDY